MQMPLSRKLEMAMTKAEKQRMEELEKEVRLARALRWSSYTAPSMIHPKSGTSEIITGYLFFGSRIDGRIYRAESALTEAWSSTVTHGHGKRGHDRLSASQGSRVLYQTKRDALVGLRLEKERDFAAALADIDRAIEVAEKEEIGND
jgi:truncated hemoglobin YjbI